MAETDICLVEIGNRITERRKGLGWTQEELAEIVGVDKQHISRIERGSRACSIDLLVILASTLHVSTDYLLMGKSFYFEPVREVLQKVIFELQRLLQTM